MAKATKPKTDPKSKAVAEAVTEPMEAKPDTPLYLVKRRIRYSHPTHPKGGQIVDRGAELPFDHLKQHQLKLLVRQGTLDKVEPTAEEPATS